MWETSRIKRLGDFIFQTILGYLSFFVIDPMMKLLVSYFVHIKDIVVGTRDIVMPNLVLSRDDIFALWLISIFTIIFFVVLVVHIRTRIKINKVLAATRGGNCRWSQVGNSYPYTLTSILNGVGIKFRRREVDGELSINDCHSWIQLEFADSRNLAKAIKTAGLALPTM